MVPRLAAQGCSFHGAFLYYFHDKNARTSERVAWTETLNMITDKIDKAWKVMAYTVKHQDRLKEVSNQKRSGAKLKNPVLAFSLSWHPEQKPDHDTMMEAARTSLEKLGLSDHETMIACHTDEPQPHIHIIVNKVHPRTGLVAALKHTKRKLQDWAREYQKKEKTMYCPQREKNYQKRQRGRMTRYANPIIVEAWQNTCDAKSFVQKLEAKGYELAQGRKRLVVVDPYGKSSNPTRDLKAAFGDDFKEQEFRDQLAEIDLTSLPTPEAVNERRRAEAKQEIEWQRAFEEKVAELIARQAEKHREERTVLSDRHQERLERKRTELESFYCLDEKQEQIDQLRDQLRTPRLVQRIGFVLFRTDRKLKSSLREAEMQQADAWQRIREALSALEQAHKCAIDRLERRQSREANALMRRLEKLRQSGRHSERDDGLRRDTDIDRVSPSLDR